LYHHLANYGTILQIYLYENVLFICCYRWISWTWLEHTLHNN
jgi:hypothetical protein